MARTRAWRAWHTPDVLIRQATTSDIAEIARVHVVAWDAAKEGLDLKTRRTLEDRRDAWSRFLAEGRGTLWVAEADGSIRGFCAIGPSRDDDRAGESEVYTLYVEPALWGSGIGSFLISRAPVAEVVSLWVSEANDRARGFYAHHGFVPDGAREAGHHVPVIRMVRDPCSPA